MGPAERVSQPVSEQNTDRAVITWTKSIWSFQGRIRRAQWWVGHLLLFAWIVAGFGLIAVSGGTAFGVFVAVGMFLLGTYWGLALDAKRWHDRNKSGWWSLVGYIPLVGPVWMLVELGCLKGTNGPNQYGPAP